MKGKTNNPNGRPKGVANKITTELKETVTAFLHNNMHDLQANYEQLEPREKLLFMEKLMRYVLPTQAAVKAEIEHEEKGNKEIIIKGVKFAELNKTKTITHEQ